MSTTQTQQQNQPSAKVQLPKQQGERKGFTNQEIQTIEADRKEPEKWNVVHLLRDGNYWHANEWSAWLVAVVITSQMKRLHPDMEIVPPTAVKKFAKNIGGEYIFVGFQEKSFDKYLPKELVLDWRDVEDGRIDVPIQMPDDHGNLTSLQRIRRHLREMDFNRPDKVVRTVNSYLGILRQTASYRLRRELFFRPEYLRIGYFDADMTRMQRAA